ncbi:MAG: hypothetical protein SGPRY_009889 [Prymnesium sp.]
MSIGECAASKMPDAFGKCVGIFLTVATLLASFPQLLKLLRAKSSVGVAPLTLALITTFGGANLAGSLVAKWPQLQECSSSANCVFLLLDVLQQLAAALVFSTLLLVVVNLPPHSTWMKRCAAALTLLLNLMLALCACFLSVSHVCSPAALSYSTAVSVVSAICAIIAYIPQLVDTWRCGGAGSLSPVFLAIQVIGSMLVNYNQIIVNKDPPAVWVPVMVSGLMQLMVLILIGYYCWR